MANFRITSTPGTMKAGAMDYRISLAGSGASELLRLLGDAPKLIERVAVRAINRTGQNVQTLVIRTIAGHINVKVRDLRATSISQGPHRAYGGVALRRAKTSEQGALVRVSGRRIPLFRFGAKQTKGGASYKILKGGGRKRIKDAFVARMSSGHEGVYRRVSWRRLPIIELFGPSIPHVAIQSQELARKLNFDAGDLLVKNVAQQVNFALLRQQGVV